MLIRISVVSRHGRAPRRIGWVYVGLEGFSGLELEGLCRRSRDPKPRELCVGASLGRFWLEDQGMLCWDMLAALFM